MLPVIYEFECKAILLNSESVYLLNDFHCGDDEIDRYVKEDALEDSECGNGVTYLVVNKRNNCLIAYYTLASTSLLYFEEKQTSQTDTDDNVTVRGMSSVEIKMFAVNTTYQDLLYYDDVSEDNFLISCIILGSIIAGIYTISMETLGVKMIVLHSVPDAYNFYLRNGFMPLGE